MDTKKLKELCEKATPGPWKAGWVSGQCFLDHDHGKGDCDYRQNGFHHDPHKLIGGTIGDREPHDSAVVVAGNYDYKDGGIVRAEDATFIAAAREALPALLSEIERLEVALKGERFSTERWKELLKEAERQKDEARRERDEDLEKARSERFRAVDAAEDKIYEKWQENARKLTARAEEAERQRDEALERTEELITGIKAFIDSQSGGCLSKMAAYEYLKEIAACPAIDESRSHLHLGSNRCGCDLCEAVRKYEEGSK